MKKCVITMGFNLLIGIMFQTNTGSAQKSKWIEQKPKKGKSKDKQTQVLKLS